MSDDIKQRARKAVERQAANAHLIRDLLDALERAEEQMVRIQAEAREEVASTISTYKKIHQDPKAAFINALDDHTKAVVKEASQNIDAYFVSAATDNLVRRLAEICEIYAEALRFYADPATYTHDDGYTRDRAAIQDDRGLRAREALDHHA